MPRPLTSEATAFVAPAIEREARAMILADRPMVGRMVSPLLVWLLPIIVDLAIKAFAWWLEHRNLGVPGHAVTRIAGEASRDLVVDLERIST